MPRQLCHYAAAECRLEAVPVPGRYRRLRLCGQLQLQRATDRGQYARLAWGDVQCELHLLAVDRRWRNLPFGLSHSARYHCQRADHVVAGGSHRAQLVYFGSAAALCGDWRLGACPWEGQCSPKTQWSVQFFGGFKFFETLQAYSGSPLAIPSSSCGTNPAQSAFSSPAGSCMPTFNPAFRGPAGINGKWGQGVTAANYNQSTNPASYFIDSTAFIATPAYQFGNTPRTGSV